MEEGALKKKKGASLTAGSRLGVRFEMIEPKQTGKVLKKKKKKKRREKGCQS